MAEYEDCMWIDEKDLGRNTPIKVEILDTEDDLYHDMAREMADAIRQGNAQGRPTVFIVPVGPVGQYRRLTRLCAVYQISCRNTVFINMDEYLTDGGQWIAASHPLSFRGFMEREFYARLDPKHRPPEEYRIFPDPNDLGAVARVIARFGGVDCCYAGIGIVGHLAFNEPEDVPVEEFRERPTRVVELTRETRTINSVTAAKGWIEGIPRLAVTVGMKEILGSRRIHIYCNREWQPAVVRKTLYGPIHSRWPASLCQLHPDCTLTMSRLVAQNPVGQLR